jgi:hypothetical protein
VGTATLDLITVALAGHLHRADVPLLDVRQRAPGLRSPSFIEDRLADPDLTPATIASGYAVFLCYLYKLFRGRGEVVSTSA